MNVSNIINILMSNIEDDVSKETFCFIFGDKTLSNNTLDRTRVVYCGNCSGKLLINIRNINTSVFIQTNIILIDIYNVIIV